MNSSLTSTPNVNAVQLGLPDIALVGKAGAGKTTGAELLQQLGYRRLSFAGPLKDFAAQLWGDEARTDREKLQKLGVGAREIDPDVWVNLLMKQLRPIFNFNNSVAISPAERKPVIVDDCRFENEWFALKAEGFVMVRVIAHTGIRTSRLKANGKWQDAAQLEHVSETAIDHLNSDYMIPNDSTSDEFYDRLVDIVIRERKRR